MPFGALIVRITVPSETRRKKTLPELLAVLKAQAGDLVGARAVLLAEHEAAASFSGLHAGRRRAALAELAEQLGLELAPI